MRPHLKKIEKNENDQKSLSFLLSHYFTFLKNNNLVEAENVFNKITEMDREGLSEASFVLAVLYDNGDGVQKDPIKAYYFYTKAAKGGISFAQYNVAIMNFFGEGSLKNNDLGYSFLAESAKNGCSYAQYFMGLFYSSDSSCLPSIIPDSPSNFAKAVSFFEAAAAQNHPMAQYCLALCYDQGIVLQKDGQSAFDLLKKSGEAGCSKAYYYLYHMMLSGQSLPKDEALSFDFLNLAAKMGHATALYDLGLMYLGKKTCYEYFEVTPDEPLARSYFSLAKLMLRPDQKAFEEGVNALIQDLNARLEKGDILQSDTIVSSFYKTFLRKRMKGHEDRVYLFFKEHKAQWFWIKDEPSGILM